jgi:hypothetical protein
LRVGIPFSILSNRDSRKVEGLNVAVVKSSAPCDSFGSRFDVLCPGRDILRPTPRWTLDPGTSD